MEDGKSGHRSGDRHLSAMKKVHEERKPIKLYSPGGSEPLVFYFNQPECNHLIALDILDIIRYDLIF